MVAPDIRQPNTVLLVILPCAGEKDLSQISHAAGVGVKVKKGDRIVGKMLMQVLHVFQAQHF